MHLYVYYEVARDEAPGLDVRVRAMQASLGDARSRLPLRRRVDSAGDAETWMEVYEDVTADFEARLDAAVDLHGIARSTGPRHVERFVDVDVD